MLSSRPVSFNFDGAHPISTKTPGRTLLKGRKENVVHHGARTVNVKSYKASLQTPMVNKSVKPNKLFQDPQTQATKGKATVVTMTVGRPLLDKTPFPNRHRRIEDTATPAPAKLAALALDGDLLSVPLDGALRPSSTRKSIRGRRSSGPHFETPVTNGNHWDVSDGEIEAHGVEAVKEEEAEVEDYDEIEYMPPTASERPYEPPFEMPDYKVAGKLLFELMHSYQYDDRNDLYWAAEKECMNKGQLDEKWFASSSAEWERLPLAELDDDDPFAIGKSPVFDNPKLDRRPSSKQTQSKPFAGSAQTIAKSTAPAKPILRPTVSRASAKGPSSTIAPATKTRSASVASTSKPAPTTARAKTSAPPPARATRPVSQPPTTASTAAATKRPATSTAMRPPQASAVSRPRAATTATRRPPSTSASRPGSTRPGTAASSGSRVSKAKNSKEKGADDVILTFDGVGEDMDFRFDI